MSFLRQNQVWRSPYIQRGGSPPTAATNLLIVRYPSAVDTPPAITDDQSPLSGIFYNYLGALIESVLAELGPTDFIDTWKPRTPNVTKSLMWYLGLETQNRISCWKSQSKGGSGTGIDNEAGQVFGLLKTQLGKSTVNWNLQQDHTVNTFQGLHIAVKLPIVFASGSMRGFENSVDHLAAFEHIDGVRGYVTAQSASSYTFRIRSSGNRYGISTPSGTYYADILLFFMTESF